MSKIGKQPVPIPQGVKVALADSQINISGPKGELSFKLRPEIKVVIADDNIAFFRTGDSQFVKALHGLTRSIIANMIKGVTVGHEKILEIIGVGYRAAKQGEDLVLNVGFSHPVIIPKVAGIQIETKENKIIVSGVDKALVGEIAARIRRVRPPEPYKGKGIKYQEELVRRKVGKAVKTVGGQV